eukprot:6140315-Pleurochrysis_carterae.AAC.1
MAHDQLHVQWSQVESPIHPHETQVPTRGSAARCADDCGRDGRGREWTYGTRASHGVRRCGCSRGSHTPRSEFRSGVLDAARANARLAREHNHAA